MTQNEKDFLLRNFKIDLSNKVHGVLNRMRIGIFDDPAPIRHFLIENYIDLLDDYNIDNTDYNVLTDAQYATIIKHCNILLQTNYNNPLLQ